MLSIVPLSTRMASPAYLRLQLARSTLPRAACRSFSISFNRRVPDDLRATSPQESALKGTEGVHQHDTSSKSSLSPATATDSTGSTVKLPQIHGDWVLFHPVYTPEELKSVQVLHRDATTWSDKFALLFARVLRVGFDVVSRYKHKPMPANADKMSTAELRKAGCLMDEHQWLHRILFLETVAGVPGMVGAMVRHLMSLRLMRRDAGWIHTLLEEAENERLHLMTFMTLKKPSIFFRALVLGAQGVFFNAFFLSYLISPRTCHRFVGFLEDEAVITYTRVIEEMEAGRIPEWSDMDAPAIAKDYWRLSPNAKLLDVMYAVRSDESTHRFVNHTLANLNVKKDVNPFAIREPNMHVKGVKPGMVIAMKGRTVEFTREESERYVHESHKLMKDSESAAKL